MSLSRIEGRLAVTEANNAWDLNMSSGYKYKRTSIAWSVMRYEPTKFSNDEKDRFGRVEE